MIALIAITSTSKTNRSSTLILAPLSLIKQWEQEIQDKIKSPKLSTLVYHGSDRTKDVKNLQKFDIVISTYSGTLQKKCNILTSSIAISILFLIHLWMFD